MGPIAHICEAGVVQADLHATLQASRLKIHKPYPDRQSKMLFSRAYLFASVMVMATSACALPGLICPAVPQRDAMTGDKVGSASSAKNTGANNGKNTEIGGTSAYGP